MVDRQPTCTKHRDSVRESNPDLPTDVLEATGAWQFALLHDRLADLAGAIRADYRRGRDRARARRPW